MAWHTSRTPASWLGKIRSLFGQGPVHEAAGRGRRAQAWMPGNPGAVSALLATNSELRTKSRDLVRRNAWAQSGIEAFVANAVGTGIKPQSLAGDDAFKTTEVWQPRSMPGMRPGCSTS